MGALVALGEAVRVDGFALAGAIVRRAEDPEAVHRAWRSLPDDVAVVVLTPMAAAALAGEEALRTRVLSVVMPP